MRFAFVVLIAALAIFGLVTPAWQAEWSKVVEAAKREGKIVLIGPQGTETREALTRGFQRKYPEITVEHSGMGGGQIPPKILTEQKAERYSTDLIITGTTTAIISLRPANAIQPIQPFLVGPNTQDPSVWLNKDFSFADEARRYNLIMSVYILPPFIYNPAMILPSEFKAWKDLLDPKWKGKIVERDPRMAGGGLAITTFWYANSKLGKEFIKKFYTSQDVILLRDDRQILDSVGQRKYPIAIGPSEVLTKEWISKGLPIKTFDQTLQEGALTTAGNGSIVVPRNPPHPNATKVYIDYLLSKEGQTEWSKAIGFASLRQDVTRDHVREPLVPKEGVQYLESHIERYVNLRDEVVEFLKTILPR